jgi:uncharacterized protein (DUF2147 family)
MSSDSSRITRAAALTAFFLPVVALPTEPARAEHSAVEGIWLTDQGDGAVEIKPCGEELCGTVYAIIRLPEPSRPPLDNRNERPERRSRPLCGMPVFGGMRKVGADTWDGGWIYDPNVGKTYAADLRLQGSDVLEVHGYIGVRLMGRTVLWKRAEVRPTRCVPPR